MILKELNLIGFGKFKNKNIKLKEGINLIYGENEGASLQYIVLSMVCFMDF